MIINAKGDIPVGTGAHTLYLISAGPNGSLLVADSANGLGLKWQLGLILPIIYKSANYTLTASDYTVIGNTTGGTFTLTLPTAVGIDGRVYVIKKSVAANTLNIATTSSQTIDGATSPVALTSVNDVRRLQSDGANWIII